VKDFAPRSCGPRFQTSFSMFLGPTPSGLGDPSGLGCEQFDMSRTIDYNKFMTNLCNICANKRALIPHYDTGTTNLTGSAITLGKFLDHTQTGSRAGDVVSIYQDPTYNTYKDLFFSTLYSGSYHVDHKGRESMVFVLSGHCGFSWDDGNKQVRYPEDAIRLVCFRDPNKVHHFSIDSQRLQPTQCDDCRNPVL
jgi:hypothetical protein